MFTKEKWQYIEQEYEEWWRHEREKPLLHLRFSGIIPQMKRPEGLITEKLYQYGPDEPAERIAEKAEYCMESRRYEFQAFPHIHIYFGPAYRVEYMGCKPICTDSTVWFKPRTSKPIEELTLQRDPESVFLPRVKEIYKAVNERFADGYVIGGGGAAGGGTGAGMSLDHVVEFFGPEEMCYLLYDEPEEVKRLIKESADTLEEIGQEINALATNALGFTAYSNLFAPVPWVVAQCDFCVMIGPDQFDEFVLPDLKRAFMQSPKYNFYHLDGPGEIIHMDKILAIPELRCMQFVPLPNTEESMILDVYERIFQAGKNMWVTGPIEFVEKVAQRIGTTKGIYWTGEYPIDDYDRVMKIAEKLMKGN